MCWVGDLGYLLAKEYLKDYPVEPGFRGRFNSGCDIANNIVHSWIKGKIVVPVVYMGDRPSAEEYVGGIGNLNNTGNSNSTPNTPTTPVQTTRMSKATMGAARMLGRRRRFLRRGRKILAPTKINPAYWVIRATKAACKKAWQVYSGG